MASNREIALYFDPEQGERAHRCKRVLLIMGIRIKSVEASQMGQTVGYLLGRKTFAATEGQAPKAPDEPILLLDGLNNQRMDILLRKLRENKVSIPLKAVVTAQNIGWTFSALAHELCEERHAIATAGTAHPTT